MRTSQYPQSLNNTQLMKKSLVNRSQINFGINQQRFDLLVKQNKEKVQKFNKHRKISRSASKFSVALTVLSAALPPLLPLFLLASPFYLGSFIWNEVKGFNFRGNQKLL